jgi:hypothetical protein
VTEDDGRELQDKRLSEAEQDNTEHSAAKRAQARFGEVVYPFTRRDKERWSEASETKEQT